MQTKNPRSPKTHRVEDTPNLMVTGFWADALFGSSDIGFTFAPAAIWLLRLSATLSPTAKPEPIETKLPSSLAIVTSLKETVSA